ncbi:MAG: hypothetical protein ACYDA2_09435 [Acidimicrobiales bacterium]
MRRGRVAASVGFSLASLVGASVVAVGVAPPPARAAAPQFAGNGILGLGDATTPGTFAGMTLNSPVDAMATTPDGKGYWVAAADGGVFAFGDAPFFGSMGGHSLYAPIVGMASPDAKGYWMGALDGGVFAFGDAPFFGSMGGHPLAEPIVGMAATHDGRGYWLVAADGGIFSFGDAVFYGSMGGHQLDSPMSGMAVTPDGKGYWLVASDGGVFAFGDAPFEGSASGQNIGTWVTGIAPTHDGNGYWLAAATAGILSYGDAVFYGPTPNEPPFSPTVAIAATPDAKGYWILQPDDIATTFDLPSAATPDLARAAQISAGQMGPDPNSSQGPYCNPYGPCEEWCSLFATWAWNQVGIPIPRYGFTGDVWKWASARGETLPPSAMAEPGDGVMFGTGPQNASTSVHMGVVAEIWPDGAVITVDGDSGPEPDGQMAVTMDGPFLLSDAGPQVGSAVYGLVRP